jgi:hypothetical protein
MKVSQFGHFLAAIAAITVCAAEASAASIGINFRRANGATLLTTPESAGFVPQAFWNNSVPAAADPQAGTSANILVDDGAGTTDTGTIYDDAGNPTAVGINWFANTSWSANNAGNGDSKLLTGYIDNTNTAQATQIQFTNIPYSHYDVIAYVGSDGNNRLGYVGIDGRGGSYYRTISQSSPAGGLAPAYVTNPAPLTNFNAPDANANYVRFTGLSESGFRLINSRISANVGVNGVQIVEMPGPAPPPPPPAAPLELLGYWSFNDSTANDSSGNGNHATLSGEATFAPGQFGNSLVLDGTRDFASSRVPRPCSSRPIRWLFRCGSKTRRALAKGKSSHWATTTGSACEMTVGCISSMTFGPITRMRGWAWRRPHSLRNEW